MRPNRRTARRFRSHHTPDHHKLSRTASLCRSAEICDAVRYDILHFRARVVSKYSNARKPAPFLEL